ncbi:MAG: 1-acyl-sn-glycerol-3-phosphate acyltransferase [Deltaproteobacteria bacterium]|nr:1-acyl-sn-glycerol-3-phosphate acyltransferase [Deltaproteobacteria bacterium]
MGRPGRKRSAIRPTDGRRRSAFVQALAFSHSTSVSPIWRRIMTVSACLVLWVLLTALAPLWIPVAFLVGVVRRCSFVVLRLLMFFWVYLAIELMGLVAATGIYLITPRNIERRHGLFFSLECWWGGSLFDWLSRFLSLSTSIEGDEQILPGPVLVFMRHASLIDTALPVAFISRAKGLRLRYVFKRELLVDPCIDVAGHASPNYFIDRGGSAQAELAGVRKLADHLGDEGVLLYPEGTRFTERKKRIALKRLAKTHPELVTMAESFKHSLPPKAGGALTLLDAAPQADVLIVAHRGLEGLAEVADLLSGAVVGQRVEIRIWRINAADIPQGEARRRWLFDWWKRVDDFVYAAG